MIRIVKDKRRRIETVWMHDLLEDMGRDIVIQESPGEPGERSRIWSVDDVNHVLTSKTGTCKVRGIQVSKALQRSTISLDAKCFSEMKNLRYLYLPFDQSQSFSGDIEYLSDQLRLLHWPQYPSPSFPSKFHAKKLAELSICDNRGLTRLWKGPKDFSSLTHMDLSSCESLKELPEFRGIPNLKELKLLYCLSLVTVPDSLGWLEKLVTLDVTGCTNLIMLPRKVYWKSLEEIELRFCDKLTALPHNIHVSQNLWVLGASHCYKIAAFPEIPTKMGSLRDLNLSYTCIRELDDSIGNLIGLEILNLYGCNKLRRLPSSIFGLQNLKELNLDWCSGLVRLPINSNILNGEGCSLSLPKLMYLNIRGCGLSDCDFLTTLDCWETLERLDMSGNNFISLPACFTKFINLKFLHLGNCDRLGQVPDLPPNVRVHRELREGAADWAQYLFFTVYGLLILSVYWTFRDQDPVLIYLTSLPAVEIVSLLLQQIGDLIGSQYTAGVGCFVDWAVKLVIGFVGFVTGSVIFTDKMDQAPVLISLTDLVVVGIEIVLLQQIRNLINHVSSFVSRCVYLLSNLEFLDLRDCERLGQLPDLPPNIRLYREGAVRLTRFSRSFFRDWAPVLLFILIVRHLGYFPISHQTFAYLRLCGMLVCSGVFLMVKKVKHGPLFPWIATVVLLIQLILAQPEFFE